MIANRNFQDGQPLTWWGQTPVYLATAVAVAQAVTMVLTALGEMALGRPEANPVLSALVFFWPEVLNGGVWRYVTYALVNPPDLWFAVQVLMFAWFGRDVEKFLGRASFAWLCGILVLAMPLLWTVLSLVWPMSPYYGAGAINFSMFLAFVVIYPRAQILFGIEARWIAAVLMGVNSLMYLAGREWAALLMLWWGLAVVVAWLRFEGVGRTLPSVGDWMRRRASERRLRVVRKEPGRPESIDPILEKIARDGIGSLSRGERATLERARVALLEKERRH